MSSSSSAAAPQTPREAFDLLLAGNRRFAANSQHYPNQGSWRRSALTQGQEPFAVIFSCADSRVPPELIFDRGLGDLFTVRTAGHSTDPGVVGTIEYGVAACPTKVLAVVGHSSCGSIAAAIEARQSNDLPNGFIGELVQRVLPSVEAANRSGRTELHEVVAENVRRTVRELVEVSDVIGGKIDAGELAIVGFVYSLSSGETDIVDAIGDLGRIDLVDVVSVQAERATYAADALRQRVASPMAG
ncbi:carbonic anhydrase [Kineosphaera limosa]|uniref:carbonic anhydrase n=1 Tax=Kineosphaera limosa NBRC 100340 TaxID=1184609 RepID=K6WQH6_9MICO|nr:carbonic anhydrase [Kineosphaera limosa]NYE02386.1 carbonic anhydrase [Kineosphaera limosa]GAB96086.1 putative carbonic anhydrase [Kineosphaera limosa NBRC 100340]